MNFNHTWWNFLESLWATGRILERIKIWNNYHRYYMRRQVDWASLNFDLKILSIYYELSKISSKLNFNFYKILIKFQDRQYGNQNVQDDKHCSIDISNDFFWSLTTSKWILIIPDETS